jgi:hypothetical protein
MQVVEAGDDDAGNECCANIVPRCNILHLLEGFMVLPKSVLMAQNSFLNLHCSGNPAFDPLSRFSRNQKQEHGDVSHQDADLDRFERLQMFYKEHQFLWQRAE